MSVCAWLQPSMLQVRIQPFMVAFWGGEGGEGGGKVAGEMGVKEELPGT